MKLKNSFKGLLLGAALASPFLMAQATQAKELVVATATVFVPFEFKEDGKYTGFEVELWDAIAKKADLDYKLRPMDFGGIIPGLQTNNIDVAFAGISIREDRAKVIDFSDPYYESGLALMVRHDDDTMKTAKDLEGKTVSVETGTATVDFMKKNIPSAKLIMFPNLDNTFLELETGRADAVVHDTPNVEYYAKTAGKGKVKVVSHLKSGDYYGFAFPKGSELVPVVNKALAELRDDGTFNELHKKWFGEEAKF